MRVKLCVCECAHVCTCELVSVCMSEPVCAHCVHVWVGCTCVRVHMSVCVHVSVCVPSYIPMGALVYVRVLHVRKRVHEHRAVGLWGHILWPNKCPCLRKPLPHLPRVTGRLRTPITHTPNQGFTLPAEASSLFLLCFSEGGTPGQGAGAVRDTHRPGLGPGVPRGGLYDIISQSRAPKPSPRAGCLLPSEGPEISGRRPLVPPADVEHA